MSFWQLLDIKENCIDRSLEDMSQTLLCDFPDGESYTIEVFLARTTVSGSVGSLFQTLLKINQSIRYYLMQ